MEIARKEGINVKLMHSNWKRKFPREITDLRKSQIYATFTVNVLSNAFITNEMKQLKHSGLISIYIITIYKYILNWDIYIYMCVCVCVCVCVCMCVCVPQYFQVWK